MIGAIKNKKPSIPSSVYVAPNATVLGDVTIGEGSSVWFGAVIRGDCLPMNIGERTNIQDLCVLHVDDHNGLTIGDDVTIGHRALLHGCTVGNAVLIGMGATIMNGVKIGEGSIIGAGALVTEGTEIPPRSLVIGMPAKVKKEITEEQYKGILKSAKHYVETGAMYIDTNL